MVEVESADMGCSKAVRVENLWGKSEIDNIWLIDVAAGNLDCAYLLNRWMLEAVDERPIRTY